MPQKNKFIYFRTDAKVNYYNHNDRQGELSFTSIRRLPFSRKQVPNWEKLMTGVEGVAVIKKDKVTGVMTVRRFTVGETMEDENHG